MSEAEHGLEALRGLHAVANTAIDPMLWLVICAGLLLALCSLVVIPAGLFQRYGIRRAACRALAATRQAPADLQLVEQAAVLRRVARTLGGDRAAGLRNEEWLKALDHWFQTDYFTNGDGRLFSENLYRPQSPGDAEASLKRLESLARRLRS